MKLSPTVVTFPGGEISGEANVMLCQPSRTDANDCVIIVDRTPFHPIDYRWPDAPGDKGYLFIADCKIPVIKCLTAAVDGDAHELHLDQEIKTVQDNSDLIFCVAHVISANDFHCDEKLAGEAVRLKVDDAYRHALSLGHSMCHLAALALNKVLNDYWRKEVKTDALGNPDFDQLSILTSKIIENGSIDHYRIGKSLRKKGFNTEQFFSNLTVIRDGMMKQINSWLQQNPDMSLTPSESLLGDRRYWSCELDGGHVTIPCGGTHIKSFNSNMKFTVHLEKLEDKPEVIMRIKCD